MRKTFLLLLILITTFINLPESLPANDTLFPSSTSNLNFSDEPPAQIDLIAENETVQSDHPFWIATRIKLKDLWHVYWKNPGDTGFPVAIEWNLPQGFTAGPIEWPSPIRFISASHVGFGYENEVLLLTQITPPKKIETSEPLHFGATVRWLACSDQHCVPGESELSLALPVENATPKPNQKTEAAFALARSLFPKKEWAVQAEVKKGKIELTITPSAQQNVELTNAYFFPEEKNVIDLKDLGLFQKKENSNQYMLTLSLIPSDKIAQLNHLKGVLTFEDKKNPGKIAESIEVDDSSIQNLNPQITSELPDVKTAFVEWEGGLAWALLFAFIGGMILNLMPCVLPVISFKVLSFVKMSGQSRSTTLRHGIAFCAGVLISFWALAGALLVLQAYGRSVGWGFQLQEPLFVAILAAVLVVFSLSLFGIFEVGTVFSSWAGQVESDTVHQKKSSGLFGSFMSGILATAVATPCTGPFLGSALGFAVTLPAALSLLVFTFLGLGMALPYLLLAAFPSLLRVLPKPGAWMVIFKEIMGFLLLGTVLWLIWVFGAQTDYVATFFLLTGFLSLAIGCWIYGKWGTPMKKQATRFLSTMLTILFFLLGGYSIVFSATIEQKEVVGKPLEKGGWEPFSAERIAELQKQGIPVLVDFTAKWCLICQTNHLVFIFPEVSSKLDELGVVRMEADWTRNDPKITQALREFGRSGVPLYVLYGKNSAVSPQILPQVLTTEIVLDALKKIEAEKPQLVIEDKK